MRDDFCDDVFVDERKKKKIAKKHIKKREEANTR